MTARDAISPIKREGALPVADSVRSDMHLLEVLPRLLESPKRLLGVYDGDTMLGVIDNASMLDALGHFIAPRFDCSVIELECTPADYSASLLARAVEDADMHLVDLISTPTDNGRLHVTLRVRCEDPAPAVLSLERYGFEITGVFGHDELRHTASLERLLALEAMLNV